MTPPTDRAQLEFLGHLQRLLTEGGFVASYKFALLLALAEIAVESGDDTGAALHVPLAAIAERVIRLYWRQALPHPAGHVLHQNTGRQATIVSLVQHARVQYGTLPLIMHDRRAWSRLVRQVARVVHQMPLFKLQTLGAEKLEFLYRNELIDDGIMLRPGVAFCLRRFHPLIAELVCSAWVRFVRTLPANTDIAPGKTDLVAFMFGAGRLALSAIAPVLRDIQTGCCFYCDKEVRPKGLAVDHFIPWARYPVDLGHNFVLADERCNSAKRDTLAAIPHLERWHQRNEAHAAELAELFDSRGVLHDLPASYRVASWAYANAERAHGQVWVIGKELIPLTASWRAALSVPWT